MNKFVPQVNFIIEKLETNNFSEEAKNLQNALSISNSNLEILGEIRKELNIEKKLSSEKHA